MGTDTEMQSTANLAWGIKTLFAVDKPTACAHDVLCCYVQGGATGSNTGNLAKAKQTVSNSQEPSLALAAACLAVP